MNWSAATIFAVGAFLTSNVLAQNGGTSCATATPIVSGNTFTADTTAAPNWMASFGPLVSPSNDVVYSVAYNGAPGGGTQLTPTHANYQFALYLIPSCASGAEPPPVRATATIGTPIDFTGLAAGTYYLAATGTAAGGAGANGTVSFNLPLPVTLQSFEVE